MKLKYFQNNSSIPSYRANNLFKLLEAQIYIWRIYSLHSLKQNQKHPLSYFVKPSWVGHEINTKLLKADLHIIKCW